MNKSVQTKINYGFTLIELLVVIAVIGVLATIVLAAINPLEQLARGRDATRIATVTQVGHAWTNWATSQSQATFPTPSALGWQTTYLTATKELSQEILAPATGSVACGASANQESAATGGSGICYTPYNAAAAALVWENLESQNSKSKYQTAAGSACAGQVAIMYDTAQGKSGLTCLATATTVPSSQPTLY